MNVLHETLRTSSTSTSSNTWFDILLLVGDRSFPCNKALLSQHSDYFKTILMYHDGPTLNLPSIPPDIFAILLAGIYSGGTYALTLENVFQVMLYAQIFQITTAWLQCKNFLMAISSTTTTTQSSIFRPIPFHPPHKFTPNITSISTSPSSSTSSSSSSVISSSIIPPVSNSLWKPWTLYDVTNSNKKDSTAGVVPPGVAIAAAAVATATTTAAASTSTNNNIDETITVEKKKFEKRDKVVEASTSNAQSANDMKFIRSIMSSHSTKNSSTSSSLVENTLDLAACDGPVTFQRIPNPAKMGNGGYHRRLVEEEDSSDDEAHAEKEMRQNDYKKNQIYQCLFCNHIFKSQYCYEKHKRRHINPFQLDYQTGDSSKKKNMILKDINVQFFPCKICGDKFPSYYFVHKHKKIWHKEILEAEQKAAAAAAAVSNEKRMASNR